MFNFEPIGKVISCYPDKFGTPRQPGLVKTSWAKIQIDKKWQPEAALEGLNGFSHLWVVFCFHLNKSDRYHAKVHPPRMGGKPMGVFATRSPHRPNPIGLSLVKIEKITSDGIEVSGIDLVQGTPVLDIKPYLPEVESVADANSGWTKNTEALDIQVHFSEEQDRFVQEWSESIGRPELKSLIQDTLRLDPRPVVYRGFEGQESPYRQTHAVRLFDGDVHFRFTSDAAIEIVKILR